MQAQPRCKGTTPPAPPSAPKHKRTCQAGGDAQPDDGKLPKVGAALEHQRAVRLGARDLVVMVVPTQDELAAG